MRQGGNGPHADCNRNADLHYHSIGDLYKRARTDRVHSTEHGNAATADRDSVSPNQHGIAPDRNVRTRAGDEHGY